MVEIGPRADEARRIATLPMEDRVCEIIELLKASSSRHAVLEEAAKLFEQKPVYAIPSNEVARHIRSLATTPPAEGKTK